MKRLDSKVVAGVGERLAVLRKAHGWTQVEFASAVGLSRGAVSQIEELDILPGVPATIRIAKAMSLSLDFLLLGEKNSVVSVEAMPPADRRLLNEIISVLKARQRGVKKHAP